MNIMQAININDKKFNINPEGYESFWLQVEGQNWEKETYRIFNENIDKDTLVIDIGAWIGPTVLYSAQIAKKCIAFEPDPIAFPRLQENLNLNNTKTWSQNLIIYQKAVSSTSGHISLGNRHGGGDSMSSVLFSDNAINWIVEAVTLEDIINEHRKENEKIFLKIDIEGGEYELIPAIKDYLQDKRITAFISLHPQFLRRSLKKSVGKNLGVPRFIKTRLEFLRTYKSIIGSLPENKRVTINGKEHKTYAWFLLYSFLRLRTPTDLLIECV
jgi:FkbM family methyltransferase